jgi:hypothetical protein
MQVDNLLIIKQPLGVILDKRVNIETMNMLDVRLWRGHFNEKIQHLCKNLHIQLQSQDLTPKTLASPNCVTYKVKDG